MCPTALHISLNGHENVLILLQLLHNKGVFICLPLCKYMGQEVLLIYALNTLKLFKEQMHVHGQTFSWEFFYFSLFLRDASSLFKNNLIFVSIPAYLIFGLDMLQQRSTLFMITLNRFIPAGRNIVSLLHIKMLKYFTHLKT